MGLYQNRIVVKVGTSTLTNDVGKSDLRAIDRPVFKIWDMKLFWFHLEQSLLAATN